MSERTRLLGVDYGTVRIGLAVSDAERRIASPLMTYARKDRESAAHFFRDLLDKEEIGGIVLGLPLHLDGRESQKSLEVRRFADWLKTLTSVPITLFDERFSSVEAESHLLAAGLTNKKRKARRDRLAAQIFLQAYLDTGCPAEPQPGPLA